jgi:hypothetical protein
MEKRQIRFFLALFLTVSVGLALPGSLASQSGPASQGREASPYVTQIRAEPRNNLIRITWIDSPDARGSVYIFRSARPFSGSIPANIRPVIVRYGVQYYIDDIDDIENIYYFVAASDSSGRRYDVIIPQINSTNVNLSQPQTQTQPAVPDSSPAPIAVEIRPPVPVQGISNLRASRDGERVIVTYNTSSPEKKAVLYRSMHPVSQPQDLLNASIVQSGIRSPFVDSPVPGFNWYYAVVYEEEISSGNIGIRPGINATTAGVIISGDQAVEQALRPIPLPMLALRNAVGEGFFLPEIIEQVPLSTEAAGMLRNTRISAKVPLVLKIPRVFVIDLESPSTGEESALFQIVNEQFCLLDWEGARVSLQHYLSLPRSRDVEARARFYLGQTLYYTGNYREALLEFLFIRSIHPVEANNWIDAILTAMVS